MTKPLYRLVYRSESCVAHGDETALDTIFKASVRNNVRDRITGALALPDGKFVQVIEGRRDHVDALMIRITRDQRHTRLTLLGAWDIEARLFAGWAMARPDPSPLDGQAFRIITEDGSGAQVTAILLGLSQGRKSLFMGQADFC